MYFIIILTYFEFNVSSSLPYFSQIQIYSQINENSSFALQTKRSRNTLFHWFQLFKSYSSMILSFLNTNVKVKRNQRKKIIFNEKEEYIMNNKVF